MTGDRTMSIPESDEQVEQLDENESCDETTKAAKRRCLVGLLLLSVVMGVLDQLVVQKRADRAVTLLGGLVSIVLIFIWCQNDSYERSYRIPKLLRLLIIFVAILGIPIYLLRTRGITGRGFRSQGTCLFPASVYWLLVLLVQSPTSFRAANEVGSALSPLR